MESILTYRKSGDIIEIRFTVEFKLLKKEGTTMYKKMYNILFNAITESLNFLSEGDTAAAAWRLEEAQRETENIFMEWDEEEPD